MRTSGFRRAPLALTLLLLGCGGAVDERCVPYEGMEDAYGLCATRVARMMPEQEDMELLCTSAGSHEGTCRLEWVSAHLGAADVETMAAACGGDPDCGFYLVDSRPDADLRVQLDRCIRFAGPFAESCMGHAGSRVAASRMTDAQILAVLPDLTERQQEIIGLQWGMVRWTIECPDGAPGSFNAACRRGTSGAGGPRGAPVQVFGQNGHSGAVMGPPKPSPPPKPGFRAP